MIAFKTHPDLTGTFKWIGKMTYNVNDINNINSLLRKFVYPYEYMDEWVKFNEASLSKIEGFYSNLNRQDMKDSSYSHAKRISKDFEIKNLGNNHVLYLKSDTLLLADVFEDFQKMCLEIYDLDPAKC